MKQIKNILIAVTLMLVLVMSPAFVCLAEGEPEPEPTEAEHVTGLNFDAAVAAYGIENIYYCSDYDNDIMAAIEEAAQNTSEVNPAMVYAGPGSYEITKKRVYLNANYLAGIYVPENVVFVAEQDAVFTDESGNSSKPMVIVSGSVYGGIYDCDFKVEKGIIFKNNTDFSSDVTGPGKQINGNVEYTEVISPSVAGIHAIGVTNFNVEHNIVRDGTNRATTGIGMMYGSYAKSVSYNEISNMGAEAYGSAISVTHSDAYAINNNIIRNAAGHGISTDTEQKGRDHAYCRINYIKNNTIKGAKHGIWLEKGCQVTKNLYGNKISNCTQNGIAVSGTKAYTGSCKWSIYSMSKNTVYNIKRSNLSVSGAYGKVRMVSANLLDISKQTNCVTLDKKAKLYITGAGNIIKRAKGNGIYVSNRSYLKITGKNTKITGNKSFGVSLYKYGKAYITNSYLKGNSNGSVRVGKGSSLTIKKCTKGKIVKSKTV